MKFLRQIISALLLIAFPIAVSAQVMPVRDDYKTNVAVGTSLYVIDPVVENNLKSTVEANTSVVKNVISFRLRNDATHNYYNTPFTCTVQLQLEKWGWNDVNPSTQNISLQMQYDPSGNYKGEAYYKFEDVHKLNVQVTGIQSAELGTPLPDIFELGTELHIERKYTFDPLLKNHINIQQSVVNNERVQLSWDASGSLGAEEFDLEWTFVDFEDAAKTYFQSLTPATVATTGYDLHLAALFRNNATRVTVKRNGAVSSMSHTVQLVFPKGYLLWRIRPVKYTMNGIRQEADWGYKYQSGSTAYLLFLGTEHEGNKNWQYAANYAEEGKKKEVISYFDGTNKLRQNVTLSNTENKAIVQENILDAMGRPAMQVLPAPVATANLKYHELFNRSASATAYSFQQLSINPSKILKADPLHSQSAPAQYYSGASGTLPVPDAEGMPFSLTEFTNDLTGKIKRQGGVGKYLQSDLLHGTTYFYGKPLQKELYRMFGSEVGLHGHYLKTMVRDANGQYSVSYTNSSGKTIATSLVGDAPANLYALPDNNATAVTEINEELVLPGLLNVDRVNNAVRFNTSFLVVSPGSYSIDYTLAPSWLQTTSVVNPTTICSDCYYDIKVKVLNEHGETLFNNQSAPPASLNTNCGNATGQALNIALGQLEPGTYYVSFEASVNSKALSFYWEQFKQTNPDIKTLVDFKREYLRSIDYTGCFSECSSCSEKLGTVEQFRNTMADMFAGYGIPFTADDITWANALHAAILSHCTTIAAQCETSPCGIYLQQMISDVSPGGQYALYDLDTYELLEEDINVLTLAKRQGLVFLDEYGAPDMITLPDGQQVAPAALNDEDFIRYFKPVWAEVLVQRHPEYCLYQYCINKNSASAAFNEKLLFLTKVPDVPANYFSTTGDYSANLANVDPFFATGAPGAGYKNSMLLKLNNYYKNPFNGFQAMSVKVFVDFVLYCLQNPVNFPNFVVPTAPCRNVDFEWMLYKTIYVSLKQEYEDLARKNTPGYENCTNCHIGTIPTPAIPEVTGFAQGRMAAGTLSATEEAPETLNKISVTPPVNDTVFSKYPFQPQGYFQNKGMVVNKGNVNFRIVPENIYNALPAEYRSAIRFYPEFRARYWLAAQEQRITLSNVYIIHLKPQHMEAYHRIDSIAGVLRASGDTLAGAQGNGENGRFNAMNVGFFCNAPNAVVYDYSTVPAKSLFIYCPGHTSPAIPVRCNTSEVQSVYQITASNGSTVYYYDVIVCEVDEDPPLEIDCEQGEHELLNGELIYISSSATPPAGYVAGSFFAEYRVSRFCTFYNVYVHTQAPVQQPCENITFTSNFVANCSQGGTALNIFLSHSTTSYVSLSATIIGKKFGQNNKEIIASQTIKVNPGSSSVSVCLPFLLSEYTEVETKLSGHTCNTCNEGVYYLNGKEVYVSLGGDAVPAEYNDPDFYTTVTVSVPGGGSCTFQNALVYDKVSQDGAFDCPLYADVVLTNVIMPPFQTPLICQVGGQPTNVYEKTFQYLITLPQSYPHNVRVKIRTCYNIGYSFDNCVNGPMDRCVQQDITFLPGETSQLYEVTVNVTDQQGGLNEVVVDFVSTFCDISNAAPECPPVLYPGLYAPKRKVFNGFPSFAVPAGNTADAAAAANGQLSDLITEGCTEMAEWWMAQLEGCTIFTSQPEKKDQLKAALINICKSGGGVDNIEGVRDLPPGVAGSYQSFRQAFVSILGSAALNELCNDLLLPAPYPSAKPPVSIAAFPVVQLNQVPQCAIDKITAWRNAFNTNNGGYTTLAAYIKNLGTVVPYYSSGTYRIGENFTMPQEDLDVLLAAIDNNCFYLSRQVLIPAYLQCGQLLTRNEITTFMGSFATTYPYISSGAENYWELLTTFINHETGGRFDGIKLREFHEAGPSDLVLGYQFANEERPYDLYDCVKDQMNNAVARAINDYNAYIEEQRRIFTARYLEKCLEMQPSMRLMGTVKEYHFTLYYYDQSGNLVKTVPPKGVKLLDDLQVSSLISNPAQYIVPDHTLVTVYKYNSLNQVVWQSTPDGGISHFWYDEKGRLSASRNAVQLAKNAFSYTAYDVLGRIIEVGEKTAPAVTFSPSDGGIHEADYALPLVQLNTPHTNNAIDLIGATQEIVLDPGFDSGTDDLLEMRIVSPYSDGSVFWASFYASGSNDQVTRTAYDKPVTWHPQSGDFLQQNLRKRVSTTSYWEKDPSATAPDGLKMRHATHYSYDVAGNVHTLWNDHPAMGDLNPAHRYKRMDYRFDLVSGKVNQVWYQKGWKDAFSYYYNYDAENRITGAYSSTDGLLWRRDAAYFYYLHGPLRRMELGHDKVSGIVQGLDYTYTLQGWLKAINGQQLDPLKDPGKDGNQVTGNAHRQIPQDVFGFMLGYYPGDFLHADAATYLDRPLQYPSTLQNGNALYNGNISYSTVANKPINNGGIAGYTYAYDQLNRIVQFRQKNIGGTSGNWLQDATAASPYSETITYDANGNIQTFNRRGATTRVNMDDLTYNYYSGSNRLEYLADSYGADPATGDVGGQSSNNYVYDAIGNLVKDAAEGLGLVNWNVYGKIKGIQKTNGSAIEYRYDAAGNRVLKSTSGNANTFYIRDAQGNPIAIYEKNGSGALTLKEQHLYGSSRIGIYQRNLELNTLPLSTNVGEDSYIVGSKLFELSNHLGNVLATIKDRKRGIGNSGKHFEAEVVSAQDYYAFGMGMPGRSWNGGGYRYGFNGQEMSNEIKGTGNSYTAEFWEYDPRLGRRWNVDPLFANAPSWSPYRAFYDNPIFWTDPTGAIEFKDYDAYKEHQTKNKGEILGIDKIGGQGHWLTSDRTGNTAVWDAANTFNIKTNNQNQYAPYEQVRDFYSWVNDKSSSMGHEVKWMKGALNLVSALASNLEGGSMFVNDEVEGLLSNLNMGIQNGTMSFFNDLLFGKYSTSPLKGSDAQAWDEALVNYEQGQVAPPIYAAASKTAITKMNEMANGSFGTWHGFLGFVGGTTPHFNWFNATITTDQARIDVPLLMMYPSTYKPKLSGFKDKVTPAGTLNARWLNIFKAYQVK